MTTSSLPKIACRIAAVLLLLSLIPIWPSPYHTVLRYVVGITSVFMIVRADELRKKSWISVWIAVAIVFNPIVPLHLPAAIRNLASLGCGLLFAFSERIFRL